MFLKKTSGYAPSHITSFFTISDDSLPVLQRGSMGVGFTLNRGVTTTIRYKKKQKNLTLRINREKIFDAKVSMLVINNFLQLISQKYPSKNIEDIFSHLQIDHKIFLPLSSGFGTSAAGALSLAFAFNKMFGLGLNDIKLAHIAHCCEIEAQTGLGTIAGTYSGGMEHRVTSGAPGIAIINPILYPSTLRVHIFYFGAFPTPTALANGKNKNQIKEIGNVIIKKFETKKTWKSAQQLATLFTKESGLLPDQLKSLFNYLESYNLYPAMLLFGNGLYFLYHSYDAKKIKKIVKRIKKMNYNVKKEFDLQIDSKGARYEL